MIYDKNYRPIRENDLVEFENEVFVAIYEDDKLVLRNVQREIYIEADTVSYDIKSLEKDEEIGGLV